MTSRLSETASRLVSGRSGVRPPDAAPGQRPNTRFAYRRLAAIATAIASILRSRTRAGGGFGVLACGNPWAKAVIQTVIWSLAGAICLIAPLVKTHYGITY